MVYEETEVSPLKLVFFDEIKGGKFGTYPIMPIFDKLNSNTSSKPLI